jgi:sugar phosphate isomerase/epimerase
MKKIKQRRVFFPHCCFLFLILASAAGATGQGRISQQGWKLGIQTWSFHVYTFAQALDKTDSCGLKFVEGIPNQLIGGGVPGKMDYHMDASTRSQVLDMLQKKGIRMVSYGVVRPKSDSDWVQLFRFAKAMHLVNIVAEPDPAEIPLISRLCDQYKINLAIHDHAKPTRYWNPDIVLAAIRGASPRVGACADIGHWLQSGLDPVACLKKLQGHILEFHIKDLNEKATRSAHDVPIGTGVINMAGVMQEMERQHFKGFSFIEYEYDWTTNVPEVEASIAYIRKEKKQLLHQ